MTKERDKKSTIILRLKNLEEAIAIGREYLQTGAHANWRGFRPLFHAKKRDGKELPPHPDWVRNWFIPRREKELRSVEKLLERISNRDDSSIFD